MTYHAAGTARGVLNLSHLVGGPKGNLIDVTHFRRRVNLVRIIRMSVFTA